MRYSAGLTVGQYKIIGSLGAGGMGEVYRARDTRLGRDVAVKFLMGSGDHVLRFEREARAVGGLNHPNIVALLDAGMYEHTHFLVSELLEGQTLREKLRGGPLPLGKALDLAVQMLQGLAAAHDRGVIHRDLKPENLFVTREGILKILDFGLAKIGPTTGWQASSATLPGTLLGSVGYMSPEQASGGEADHRSDIFAFGAILYEMLSGRRAFEGDSAISVLNAILKDDPPDLAVVNANVCPHLARVVQRCLEKDPANRFQSARDLAFELQLLTTPFPLAPAAGPRLRLPGKRIEVRPWTAALIGIAFVLLLSAVAMLARRTAPTEPPRFHQLTYERGLVRAARFAPDGQTVLYSVVWGNHPEEIFSTRLGSTESRSLGIRGARLASISPSGEMALILNEQGGIPATFAASAGTLAIASLAGGGVRELLADVRDADWAPDGLVVTRRIADRDHIEFPAGTPVYRSSAWIADLRTSPRGDLVAFVDAEFSGVRSINVVDRKGHSRELFSTRTEDVGGLAWSPTAEEIWFTTTEPGGSIYSAIHAISLDGRHRAVHRATSPIRVMDVAKNGTAIVTQGYEAMRLMGRTLRDEADVDLSSSSQSFPIDLSRDGRSLLTEELRHGALSLATLRPMDGSPAVRLVEGDEFALSADGRRIAVFSPAFPDRLSLVPTRAGDAQSVPLPIRQFTHMHWFPDGRALLVLGSHGTEGTYAAFRLELEGGLQRITAPDVELAVQRDYPISPDGRWVVVRHRDGGSFLYPAQGGKPRRIEGIPGGDVPIAWTADGKSLYVREGIKLPQPVYLFDLDRQVRRPWKELAPAEPVGVAGIRRVLIAPAGDAYVYCYVTSSSALHEVHGLR